MKNEVVKDKIKNLPNEIILLSYYQAYCQTCRGDKRRTLWLESFGPTKLPHNIPNLFEYLFEAKDQFKVYEKFKSLDKEKIAEKEKVLNSSLSTQKTVQLFEQIDKKYDYEVSRFQTLWNFIVSFNDKLEKNSADNPMSLLKEGRPVTRYYYHARKGCLIAAQNLVFGIQEEPWGNNETMIYTKNDKDYYDKLFKNNAKTTNK